MSEPPARHPEAEPPPIVGAAADDVADEVIAPAEIPLNDAGCLDVDVECRRCGYNLRGLTVEGRCPECMTAVGRSVHGDLLRFCDPGWVEKLANGMRLFVAAIVASIVIWVGMIGGVTALFAVGQTFLRPILVLLMLVMAAVTALMLLAYWKITTPDPGRDESERPITARAVARYCLIAGAVVGLATSLVQLGNLGALTTGLAARPVMAPAVLAVTAVAAVTGLVGMAALFIYATSLAGRIPDGKLERHTRIVMWGYLIATGLMQVLQLGQMAIAAVAGGSQALDIAYSCSFLVVILPGLVFWIWGIVLVFQYRNRMTAAACQARQTWAAMEEG